MSTLLYIQASPRIERSHSRAVADAFIATYTAMHPDDKVITLDLFEADLPVFAGLALEAKYALLHGKEQSDAEQAAWAPVAKLISQFKDADKYVMAVPMWNFGIPYRLKQYIDILLQPAHTFSYTPETGYTGLVTGKPVLTVYARGGEYPVGSDDAAVDHQTSYLALVLGFIGFTDIRSIVVEPTLMAGPDMATQRTAEALSEAAEAAHTF